MCARFCLSFNPRLFTFIFGEKPPKGVLKAEFAPTDSIPVLRISPTGDRELVPMRWGLIPSWANELPKQVSTYNARAETLSEKPTFREAFAQRHCLLPASSFFEWHGKEKQEIRPEGLELFAFAGLWETWQGMDTCTLITCPPNAQMAEIADRMPVMLAPNQFDLWLNSSAPSPELLIPFEETLTMTPEPGEQPGLFDL